MKRILSLRDLSWQLGIPVARLRKVADNIESHYKEWPRKDKKNKHKVRILRVPSDELKEIQRRIKKCILDPMGVSDQVHGGIRGRSPESNATRHLNQPCVINIDVKNFFDNVRHYVVFRMFRHELGFGRDVASLITRLTTFRSRLPQGAPTSTAVANLLLTLPVDGPIFVEAERIGVRYTRFVDDITFSGGNPRPLINAVARMLSQKRLPVWRKKAKWHSKAKLRITPRSRPQEVTGLIVNSVKGPSVSRPRRDRVRAAIFGLRGIIDEATLKAEVASIRGRIEHVRRFNPGSAARLQRYLEATIGVT